MKKTVSYGWIDTEKFDFVKTEVLAVGSTRGMTPDDLEVLQIREEGDRTFLAVRTTDKITDDVHVYLQHNYGFETIERGS